MFRIMPIYKCNNTVPKEEMEQGATKNWIGRMKRGGDAVDKCQRIFRSHLSFIKLCLLNQLKEKALCAPDISICAQGMYNQFSRAILS